MQNSRRAHSDECSKPQDHYCRRWTHSQASPARPSLPRPTSLPSKTSWLCCRCPPGHQSAPPGAPSQAITWRAGPGARTGSSLPDHHRRVGRASPAHRVTRLPPAAAGSRHHARAARSCTPAPRSCRCWAWWTGRLAGCWLGCLQPLPAAMVSMLLPHRPYPRRWAAQDVDSSCFIEPLLSHCRATARWSLPQARPLAGWLAGRMVGGAGRDGALRRRGGHTRRSTAGTATPGCRSCIGGMKLLSCRVS